jgi:serralysin
VITDFAQDDDIPSAVAVQSNGRIVVAGLAASAHGDDAFDEDFALARYDRRGRLDTTFGGDGRVTTDTGGGNDGAQAVALQADGRIVAAGTPGFTLVRYLGRGALHPPSR